MFFIKENWKQHFQCSALFLLYVLSLNSAFKRAQEGTKTSWTSSQKTPQFAFFQSQIHSLIWLQAKGIPIFLHFIQCQIAYPNKNNHQTVCLTYRYLTLAEISDFTAPNAWVQANWTLSWPYTNFLIIPLNFVELFWHLIWYSDTLDQKLYITFLGDKYLFGSSARQRV